MKEHQSTPIIRAQHAQLRVEIDFLRESSSQDSALMQLLTILKKLLLTQLVGAKQNN